MRLSLKAVDALVINQTGFDVTVAFYEQVGADLPVNPQITTAGQIVASQIALQTADPYPKFARLGWHSHWELALSDPDALHVAQYRIPTLEDRPGPATQHLESTLSRI